MQNDITSRIDELLSTPSPAQSAPMQEQESADAERSAPGILRTAADAGLQLTTSAMMSVAGDALRWTGDVINSNAERTMRLQGAAEDSIAQNRIEGTPLGNLFRNTGDFNHAAIQRFQQWSVSEENQQRMADTMPSGDFLDISSWKKGEDPSFAGGVMVLADLLGSYGPEIAASLITRGMGSGARVAAPAVASAGSGGGAMSRAEGERISGMSFDELAERSGLFNELVERGYSQGEAKQQVQALAEYAGAETGGVISGSGGAVMGYIMGPARRIASGASRPVRAATLGSSGAVSEGAHEFVTTVGSRLDSANRIDEMDRNLTEDTLQDVLLGSVGGGGIGVGSGLTSRQPDDRAEAPVEQQQEILGLPSPAQPQQQEQLAIEDQRIVYGEESPEARQRREDARERTERAFTEQHGRPRNTGLEGELLGPEAYPATTTPRAEIGLPGQRRAVGIEDQREPNTIIGDAPRIENQGIIYGEGPQREPSPAEDVNRRAFEEPYQGPRQSRKANREVAPEAQARIARGRRDQAWTPDNEAIDVSYALVDLADLQISHDEAGRANPRYPQELQQRDRSNVASRAWIAKTAGQLNPARLSESPNASDGAPIIGKDGAVESGNGRAAAIRLAYLQDTPKAQEYKAHVTKKARELGISPEEVMRMQRPILVRVREGDDEQRKSFTRKANKQQVASQNRYEQARTDAELIDSDMLKMWSPSETDGALAASNQAFIRAFAKELGQEEAQGLMRGDGIANADMARRIEAALFHRAYGSEALTEMQVDMVGPYRNLMRALSAAAPDFAMARDLNQDIANPVIDTISKALQVAEQARQRGLSINEMIAQQDAFSEATPQEVQALASFISVNRSKPTRLSAMLSELSKITRQQAEQSGNQSLFGDEPLTTQEIISESEKRSERPNEADAKPSPRARESGRDEGRQADAPPENLASVQEASEQSTSPSQEADSFNLKTQTQQELEQQDQQRKEREQAKAKAEREAEQREQADREADDFVLAGSNSKIDQMEARGQGNLLDQSAQNAELEQARAEVDTSPTEAQKEAGNYKKGHAKFQGLDITLENPKGSTRSGTDADGKTWSIDMAHDYGYIKRTEGADGDQIDVFIGDSAESSRVFVVDQINRDDSFDEHKVMLGFDSKDAAEQGYLANYEEGWQGMGAISEISMDEFKRWVKEGDTTKPYAQPVEGAQQAEPEEKKTDNTKPRHKLGETEGDNLDDLIKARYVRRTEDSSGPFSRAGYAMFAEVGSRSDLSDAQAVAGELRSYGDQVWVTDGNTGNIIDSSELEGYIEERLADQPDLLDSIAREMGAEDLTASDVAEMFSPEDIIDSAGGFDNEALLQILWDEILWPNDIDGIRTPDGIIIFDTEAGNEAISHAGDAETFVNHKLGESGEGLDATSLEQTLTEKLGGLADLASVVQSADSLPQDVKDHAAANGIGLDQIKGVWHNGKAYIVADNLTDTAEAVRTVLHEVVGHQGIHNALGADLNGAMDSIYRSFSGSPMLRDLKQRYPHLDPKTADGRRTLAEELVAHLAETGTKPSLFKRFVAAVRSAARKLFPSLKFSENDVNALIQKAREHVRNSDPSKISSSPVDTTRYSLRDRVADLRNRKKSTNPLNDKLRESDKTAFDRLKKNLQRWVMPGGLMPDSVTRLVRERDRDVRLHEFDIAKAIGQLDQAIKATGRRPSKLNDADWENYHNYLTGKDGGKDLTQSEKDALNVMREHVDGLTREHIQATLEEISVRAEAEGKTSEADLNEIERLKKMASNIGQYLNRSYKAFDDPKWYSKLSDEVIDAARQHLVDQYKSAGESGAEAARKAEVTLSEIVKTGTAYESLGSFIAQSKLGSKDLSMFIKRKQIAPEILALLGEYKDPRINYAKSVSKMASLIANSKLLQGIRETGIGSFIFEKESRPPEATVQLAGEQSDVYSPLNGLWTTPEIRMAFEDAMGQTPESSWLGQIIKVNGLVKYGKTVLSPTTAMRNFYSSFFFNVANGHFNVLGNLKKASASWDAQVKGKTSEQQAGYIRKLTKLGVIFDGGNSGELVRMMTDGRVRELLEGKSGTAYEGLRWMNQKAIGFYRFGDDFWKIVGWENEKAGLIEAGFSEAEAEKMAAERIQDTYPTYSRVPKGGVWLSRFPLAGTFVSFPAEIIRTTVNMMRITAQDYKSGNPQLKKMAAKRMVGMALASGGMFAMQALTKAMFGVTDEEEEALRDLAPPWQKNSTFIFTGRDKDGNIRYFDMTFLDPYGYWKRPIEALLRDQPWEDAMASTLTDMVTPFFGVDIAFQSVLDVVRNQKGSGGQVYKERDGVFAQSADISLHLARGLAPGFVNNIWRTAYAAADVKRSSGQPYSMYDEMLAWAGFRASTFDPATSLYYRTFDFNQAAAEARNELSAELRNPNGRSDRQIRAAWSRAQRKQDEAFREMSRLVQASLRSGLDERQVVQMLRLSGISGTNIAFLLRNETPPLNISDQSFRSAYMRARLMVDNDAAEEVRSRFRRIQEARPE